MVDVFLHPSEPAVVDVRLMAGPGGVPVLDAEVGAGVEAQALVVTWVLAEVGISVESASVTVQAAGFDLAVGADVATTLVAYLEQAETGAGFDVAQSQVALTAIETGAGVEGAIISLAASESGTGIESQTLAVALVVVDAGRGVEVEGDRQLSSIDAGAGDDRGALWVLVAVSEAASGVDLEALGALLSQFEAALGQDASLHPSALLTALEVALGVELETLSQIILGGRLGVAPDDYPDLIEVGKTLVLVEAVPMTAGGLVMAAVDPGQMVPTERTLTATDPKPMEPVGRAATDNTPTMGAN